MTTITVAPATKKTVVKSVADGTSEGYDSIYTVAEAPPPPPPSPEEGDGENPAPEGRSVDSLDDPKDCTD